jgi:hypothetical protein
VRELIAGSVRRRPARCQRRLDVGRHVDLVRGNMHALGTGLDADLYRALSPRIAPVPPRNPRAGVRRTQFDGRAKVDVGRIERADHTTTAYHSLAVLAAD